MVFAEPLFTRIQFLTIEIDTGCPRLFFLGKKTTWHTFLTVCLKKILKIDHDCKYIKVRF